MREQRNKSKLIIHCKCRVGVITGLVKIEILGNLEGKEGIIAWSLKEFFKLTMGNNGENKPLNRSKAC